MSVFEDVKKVIAEELGADEASITPGSKIIEDLGADSLDVVELIMALEEKFDISIPDEDGQKIATVDDIVKYIEAKK